MTIGINLAMMLPAQSWAPTLDYNLSPNQPRPWRPSSSSSHRRGAVRRPERPAGPGRRGAGGRGGAALVGLLAPFEGCFFY